MSCGWVSSSSINSTEKEKSTIVLITGDADVTPVINRALEHKWNVEVMMWRHTVAASIRKLQKKFGQKVKVRELDDNFDTVTYIEKEFKISGNEAHVKKSGIVLKVDEKEFIGGNVSPTWCNNMEAITQRPFQYCWLNSDKNEYNTLCLYFKQTETTEDGGHEFDITEFMQTLGKHLKKLFIIEKPQAYISYKQATTGYFSAAKGYFSVVEDLQFPSAEHKLSEEVLSSDDNKDDFKLINYHRPHSKQLYSKPCLYQFNCINGSSCHYNHTEEEKAYFRKNSGKGNPNQKVRLCSYHPKCKKPKQECDYAHGEEDAWCRNCHGSNGHYTNNCPNSSTVSIFHKK